MKITKQAGTYNMYRLEASFGELDAIRSALEVDHSGSVADELFHTVDWYFRDNHLPMPGQEAEDIKKQKDAEKTAEEGGGALSELPPPEEGEMDDLSAQEAPGDMGQPDDAGFSPAEDEDFDLPPPPIE